MDSIPRLRRSSVALYLWSYFLGKQLLRSAPFIEKTPYTGVFSSKGLIYHTELYSRNNVYRTIYIIITSNSTTI